MKRSLSSNESNDKKSDRDLILENHESRSKYILFYEDEKVRYYKVDFDQMIIDKQIDCLPRFSNCDFISVTTIISKIFPKFDQDKIIGVIKENPYSGYGDKKDKCIDDLWSTMRKDGSSSGTKMHSFVEESLKPFILKNSVVDLISGTKKLLPYIQKDIYSVEFDNELPENDPMRDFETKENITYFKMILEGLESLSKNGHPNLSKYIIYKLEWRIFDESVNISGTIDCVLINPDNNKELILLDWKRSKEIRTTNKYESCDHEVTRGIPNCNERKYSVQLNLYKRILENKYNSKITGMYIINVSPIHQICKIFPVKEMKETMDKLYEFREKCLVEENKTKT